VLDQHRIVSPGPRAGTVRTVQQEVLVVPAGYRLLPPGDAALTRRVKQAEPCWTVQEKRGRKTFSLGIWARAELIEQLERSLEVERAEPAYAKNLESGRKRRAIEQSQYEEDFQQAVFDFLRFADNHAELGRSLAKAIAEHAVPVGSGTVARTKRIPIAQRAEAATIAWLRHATTGYDNMEIPRVKGMRREVRRMLAERSRLLLGRYRGGEAIAEATCLLRRGLRHRATGAAKAN